MQTSANLTYSHIHQDLYFCGDFHLRRCQPRHFHVHSLQDHASYSHDILHDLDYQDHKRALQDALY